jgi:hypothetical protein
MDGFKDSVYDKLNELGDAARGIERGTLQDLAESLEDYNALHHEIGHEFNRLRDEVLRLREYTGFLETLIKVDVDDCEGYMALARLREAEEQA